MRQTGRTTKILLSALTSTKENIIIMSPTIHIRNHLFNMSVRLFPDNIEVLNCNRIKLGNKIFHFEIPYTGCHIKFYGLKNIDLYEDHTLNEIEFYDEKQLHEMIIIQSIVNRSDRG